MLAKAGTRFTDGYVTNCVCSPSRAALLTGRYQHRYGHEFNIGPAKREIEEKLGLPPQNVPHNFVVTACLGLLLARSFLVPKAHGDGLS